MTGKPQLVLDVAGVLVTNLSPLFWEELAMMTGVSGNTLKTRLKRDIREELWTGKMDEAAFWRWLKTEYGMDIEHARALLYQNLKPLTAFERLPEWSQLADIHLLSNHRTEWLTPVLRPIRKFVTSVTISGEVGYCKPDPRIYERVQSFVKTHQAVLFVDDQYKNLVPASVLGWKTLLADEHGRWMGRVTSYLIGDGMTED